MQPAKPFRLTGRAALLWGIGLLVVGFFIGGHLRGLELLGFVLVLVGSLALLFGILRLIADRTDRSAG